MTKQIGDWLQLGGERYNIWPPLELPCPHKNIIEKEYQGFSSFCMRGYFATWNVENGVLWLTELSGMLELKQPIKALWITTEIDLLKEGVLTRIYALEPRFKKAHCVAIENGLFMHEEKYVWDSRDQVKRGWPPG